MDAALSDPYDFRKNKQKIGRYEPDYSLFCTKLKQKWTHLLLLPSDCSMPTSRLSKHWGRSFNSPKADFFYCTQGEMSLVLGNRAFEIHRGDIYIYPPLSKTYIRMLSDDLHGTVGVADFDFVFTLANSISNTQNHLYMRENPCISLNDEQRRRIEELIELIWRRERSQGSAARMRITVSSTTNCSRRSARRSAAKSPRPTFSTIRSSRSNRIARTGFSRVSSSRSPRILRTHHSVSFYAAEQCLTPRYFSTIVREKIGPQRPAMDHDVHYRRGEEAALRSRSEHQGRSPKRWDSPTSPSSAAISSNTSVSPMAFRSSGTKE